MSGHGTTPAAWRRARRRTMRARSATIARVIEPERDADGRRQVALAVVAFVATLVLLVGLSSASVDRAAGTAAPRSSPARPDVADARRRRPRRHRSSAASLAGRPSPSASGAGRARPRPRRPRPAVEARPRRRGRHRRLRHDRRHRHGQAPRRASRGRSSPPGDNAYPSGRAKDFQDCYDPVWGRVRDRTRPSPGNHDWQTKDLKGYLDYFGKAAAAPDGDPWYSYDLGAWHVVVLDSMCGQIGGCGKGSAQGKWLAADLAASNGECTLAIWHEPR